MNSRQTLCKKKLSSGFGLHLEEQLGVLNQMKDCISAMRVIGRKGLLPFQKGILLSISSMKGLFEEMQTSGGNFILTSHCNSDPCENTFSCLRGLGAANNHPGPVDTMNRIRLLIVSNDAKLVVEKSAVQIESAPCPDFNLSSAVLGQTFPGKSPEA